MLEEQNKDYENTISLIHCKWKQQTTGKEKDEIHQWQNSALQDIKTKVQMLEESISAKFTTMNMEFQHKLDIHEIKLKHELEIRDLKTEINMMKLHDNRPKYEQHESKCACKNDSEKLVKNSQPSLQNHEPLITEHSTEPQINQQRYEQNVGNTQNKNQNYMMNQPQMPAVGHNQLGPILTKVLPVPFQQSQIPMQGQYQLRPILTQRFPGPYQQPQEIRNIQGQNLMHQVNFYRMNNQHSSIQQANMPRARPSLNLESSAKTEITIGTLNIQNARSNELYLKQVLKRCEILCIQEHWLYSSEKHYLNTVSNMHEVEAKSVDDNIDTPYRHFRYHMWKRLWGGGVATFWRKDIDNAVKYMPDGNERIIVLTVNTKEQPICLINVYMPSGNENCDEKYKDMLAQLEEIIEKYQEKYQIMLCGDLNASLHRDNRSRDMILKQFLINNELEMVHNYPIKPTFYNHNKISKSQIGYFLHKRAEKNIRKENLQPIERATVDEVQSSICKMKTEKSPDVNGIEEIIPYIVFIINLIFDNLDVPEKMKSGTVTSVLKTGKDKKYPENYRGITVTNTFSTVLESLLKDRIEPTLLPKQSKLQRGFTDKASSLNTAFIVTQTADCYKELLRELFSTYP
ncbi:unnamed protein product [Mytilus edulis]|uniref:Endonuclease/exonuclease/phosphatase domain-containing protein n=1 Tax=Mytilus edulis TaxID=6550 RepID=A0A8S3VI98_MYTED|nr:unnamed protein product [Mytilus edulis]